MNKTIAKLKQEMDKLYNRNIEDYYDYASMNLDCGDHDCSHYGTMIHKDKFYHLCNDIYSGKYCPGWHPIYCETLDICFEYHNRMTQRK